MQGAGPHGRGAARFDGGRVGSGAGAATPRTPEQHCPFVHVCPELQNVPPQQVVPMGACIPAARVVGRASMGLAVLAGGARPAAKQRPHRRGCVRPRATARAGPEPCNPSRALTWTHLETRGHARALLARVAARAAPAVAVDLALRVGEPRSWGVGRQGAGRDAATPPQGAPQAAARSTPWRRRL